MCTKREFNTQEFSSDEVKRREAEQDPVVVVHPMQLNEGSKVFLTPNHISVVVEYAQYDVSESDVVLKVLQSPRHGTLHIDASTLHPDPTMFTVQDLHNRKVSYIHDGLEDRVDSIALELEFVGRTELPAILQRKHRFSLNIEIMPVNDPPRIVLNSGNRVGMVAHSKLPLSSSLIQAVDPDTNPHQLVIYIQEPELLGGYFEDDTDPGHPIGSFTQKDINRGKVNFVHHNGKISDITLFVSDGHVNSSSVILRVTAYTIDLHLEENTGVQLPHDTSVVITSNNLTYTNGLPDDVPRSNNPYIVFKIVDAPKYGRLEKLRGGDGWIPTDVFLQKQIERGKVRYVHTHTRPSFDSLTFTVTCGNVTSPKQQFDIEFLMYRIELRHNTELVLDNTEQATITDQHLQVVSTDGAAPSEINYTLLANPRYGYLTRGDDRKFVEGANFTQADINAGVLSYRYDYDPYTTVHDNFEFRVTAPRAYLSSEMFFIRYNPNQGMVKIYKKKLQVLEGARAIISKEVLWIESKNKEKYVFTITQFPQYGTVQGTNRGLTQITDANITTFTTEDIRDGRVVYQHDDSEHDRDQIHFAARPMLTRPQERQRSINGSLQIFVVMRNDNPPIRTIHKVFHVVSGGERLLTISDIAYTDPDIDFDDNDLEFTRRGIANGDLVSAENPNRQVFRFTQKELSDNKLLFRHSGPDYGKTVIWVTDGQFYSTGLLEVRASDPYVMVSANTGVLCLKGSSVIISGSNLSLETNVYAKPANMQYLVTRGPKHGIIFNSNIEASRFTQADINTGLITYQHDDSLSQKDEIEFTARVGLTDVRSQLHITIILSSYSEAPRIIENRSIVVREGDEVVIDDTKLKVVHPAIAPSHIIYNVKNPPRKGILRLKVTATTTTTTTTTSKSVSNGVVMYVTRFTQADIDNGNLEYVQTEPRALEDAFSFDVTNGLQTLQDLLFDIEIIPTKLPFMVQNITVKNQGSKMLSLDYVTLPDNDHIYTIFIVQEPHHGWIENIHSAGEPLTQFTSDDLKKEVIYYVHNDSTLSDMLLLKVQRHLDGMQSSAKNMFVRVKSADDQTPEVIRNNPLDVLAGSETAITRQHLLSIGKKLNYETCKQ